MTIAPLEYMVIGCPGNQFMSEILPELNAIQEKGQMRVIDLLFVRKDADNTVTVLEARDLDEEERAAFGPMQEDLIGVVTHEDIATLSSTIPPDTSAVIVLLEHLWLGKLEAAVEKANGTIFIGGMIAPQVLEQLEQELVAAQQQAAQQQTGQSRNG